LRTVGWSTNQPEKVNETPVRRIRPGVSSFGRAVRWPKPGSSGWLGPRLASRTGRHRSERSIRGQRGQAAAEGVAGFATGNRGRWPGEDPSRRPGVS
jgi:hypothetical protein